MAKIARPPYCKDACKISGVFTNRFGRHTSLIAAISSANRVSSYFEVFHVKYVYDWENPTFANPYSRAGRVNASAKKIISGFVSCTLEINHCQKFAGFVCGLSTRNVVTPISTQNITIL